MTESLYERIGGRPAVKAVVAKLYNKLLSDPLLIPFFEGIDAERLRSSQAAFVAMATGSPTPYTGQSLRTAHRRLVEEKGLSDQHFDAVARHLDAALSELGVPHHLRDDVLGIVETTRADILNR